MDYHERKSMQIPKSLKYTFCQKNSKEGKKEGKSMANHAM